MYALGKDLVKTINFHQAFYWTQKAAAQGGAVQVETHVDYRLASDLAIEI
jgi:TPR repeat protein